MIVLLDLWGERALKCNLISPQLDLLNDQIETTNQTLFVQGTLLCFSNDLTCFNLNSFSKFKSLQEWVQLKKLNLFISCCFHLFCLKVRSSSPLLSAIKSPCSRRKRSVRSTTPCWRHLVSCSQLGGRGWTAATTAGCRTAAPATPSPSPDLSVEAACWGFVRSTSMQTKPASRTPPTGTEPSASRVRLKHTQIQPCHHFPPLPDTSHHQADF